MLAPRLLVVLLGIAVSSTVLANGRFPASRGVSAQADSWMVPVTFGMLVSNDGGSSFYWLCEDALGYGGTYDPDHLVDAQGDRWITSFDGIRVSRDGGCTWNAVGAPFDTLFPGALTMDSAGRLWVVTAQAGVDNGAYRNDDSSGAVFGALGLSSPEGLFTSIAVAPSLTSRAYVAGFVIGELGLPEPLLLSTNDDGASWDPLPVDAFDLGDQPTLEVRAVSQADPDVVFVSVGRTPENGGDVLYRSVDGGQSFAEALTMVGGIEAVLARANGEIVVGAGAQGTWVSANAGQSFEQVEGGPLLSCVYERADGSLLGCGSNVAPDPLAIGSSSDGRSWDSVLTFDAIAGPLECEAGTPQRDSCAELWPGLVEQLGIGGDQPDAGPGGRPPSDGCGCRSGDGFDAWPMVALVVLLMARRRTRWSTR